MHTTTPREEWPDADFDFVDGDDEDWDLPIPIIRPPLQSIDDSDDEGVSTIKATAPPCFRPTSKPTVEPIDEDFEDAFALPCDLTQLSLAPLSLNHRSSKNSLEWGDKETSSSSQSSDAYSSLGFADASHSNSASSPSLPDTETEEEEDELDGLVLPTALFESGHSGRQLKRILDLKKKAQLSTTPVTHSLPNPEDDFEMGLIINDDLDLSPSRLVYNTQSQRNIIPNIIPNIPPHRPSSLRPPPPKTKLERAKSPSNPPTSSAKQLQKLRLSPSPPLRPPSRSQTFQSLVASLPSPSPSPSSQNFLSSKPGSLRGQKSHSGLKPPTPPATTRKLNRKASMSSLIESSHIQPSAFSPIEASKPARYDEPTAASRAKSHKSSTSRIHDFKLPPSRPSTPSSNPAALRLTMPTQSRLRSRPALSQVFASPVQESPPARAPSPLPPRPPSGGSTRASLHTVLAPAVPKLLRRPKRPKTYGDGTELDGIDDLPTDREKEVRYRVQPKGYGNRVPGASFPSKEKEKSSDKGSGNKKSRRDSTTREPTIYSAPSTNNLRRSVTRVELPSQTPVPSEPLPKKRKNVSSPNSTKRKPTLIRNLGGAGAPKVVGEMKWNPQSLRWEGNDQILRDFDASVGTSARPALITHLTGSSIGSPIGSSPRIVGNMVFDPTKMCWISTLPPDEDEPDVFANLADDEEDAWETKGGTIRANVPRNSDVSIPSSRAESSSPTDSYSRSISESGSDRGSRASMVVCDIDDEFIDSCRKAEERHRMEMKGWKTSLAKRGDSSLAMDRSHLFEIRALATRKY